MTRTVELARQLWDRGAFVVFLSTNLVFDGTSAFPKVDDPPNPTTAYGRQKAEAEDALRKFGAPLAIVRLTKVVHPSMPLLVKWAASLRRREPIAAFIDMVFSPIPLRFVAAAIQLVAQRRAPGIFHISAEKDLDYHMLAESLAESVAAPRELVVPSRAPATPPRHATLRMRDEDVRLMNPPAAAETIRQLVSAFA